MNLYLKFIEICLYYLIFIKIFIKKFIIIILNTYQIMKKTKNQYEHKHKIKFDKSNKRHFKNKCLMEDNNEDKATNREILEKLEIISKNVPFPHKKEEEIPKNGDENSIEDIENNSDNSSEEEEVEIKKENFNLKLFMLVNN